MVGKRTSEAAMVRHPHTTNQSIIIANIQTLKGTSI
jgi:hypothetical protein